MGSIEDSVNAATSGQGGTASPASGTGSSTDTPIIQGTADAPEKAKGQTTTPNSIYEKIDTNDGTVRNRTFYDNDGNDFCRQCFKGKPHRDSDTGEKILPHQHNRVFNQYGIDDKKSTVKPVPQGYDNKPSNNNNSQSAGL